MNTFDKMTLHFLLLMGSVQVFAQPDTIIYKITVEEKRIKIGEKEIMAMTLNGSIPGPTLRFKEGNYAVIYDQNNMDVETSIHWYGILLPNYCKGASYLTTPPFEPFGDFKYEFPIGPVTQHNNWVAVVHKIFLFGFNNNRV